MSRTTKYLLAFAIVGLIYLIAFGLHALLKQDILGLGWLFIYAVAIVIAFIAALAAIVFDLKKSSLFYLSACLFNLSLCHIFIITGFNGVFIAFMLPVVMGVTMLIMHINVLKQNK